MCRRIASDLDTSALFSLAKHGGNSKIRISSCVLSPDTAAEPAGTFTLFGDTAPTWSQAIQRDDQNNMVSGDQPLLVETRPDSAEVLLLFRTAEYYFSYQVYYFR